MKFLVDDRVRRPIGAKILGITLILLLLMAVVTHTSNSNLKKLNEVLAILSEYYIPLDQSVADLRMNHNTQIRNFERVVNMHPKKDLEGIRQEGEKLAQGLGSCERDGYRAVSQKAREMYPAPEQYGIIAYEMQRYCTDRKIGETKALVDKALTVPAVTQSPELTQKFTKLEDQLARIPRLRSDLHNTVLKYMGELKKGHPQSINLMEDQFEQSRRAVSQETGNIGRLLHQYTRDAATKAKTLERQAFRFNWGMTIIAAIFGLFFAVLLTRNLVSPLRKLLSGAKQIEEGNLNIQVQVSSADEIALLANSFNYMVSGLKEKETIKETFGKYVDPKIVRTLLDDHTIEQGGEKRIMTIFFSDIKGFTRMSEQLAPNSVVRLLNHYISAMSGPIRGNHGIIDKYIGDAIMAFWGPPFTDEGDHAVLACRAALEQQKRLVEFRKSLPDIIGLRKGIPDFEVRMGICTGDVIVGTIGAEAAKSYTVIGDTVNLASRLEAANKIYGTSLIVSGDTIARINGQLEARELDTVRVVGKTESVRIFELLGMRGEVAPGVLQIRDEFEKGLERYRNRDWTAAMEHFESCLKVNPNDAPSRLFKSRVEAFMANPPADDWNGVWNLTEK